MSLSSIAVSFNPLLNRIDWGYEYPSKAMIEENTEVQSNSSRISEKTKLRMPTYEHWQKVLSRLLSVLAPI